MTQARLSLSDGLLSSESGGSVYTASVTRLQALPPVFSAAWLRRQCGWDASTASVYLNRWKRKGWIKMAGPRLGVYFNTLSDPEVVQTHLPEAIRLAYPSAHVLGESVLHAEGWTTQIPQRLSVGVLARPSLASIDNTSLHARRRKDMQAWHVWCESVGQSMGSLYGLPALPPALALVDAWNDPDAWHPDPDDIDVPEDAFPALAKACHLLHVQPPTAWRETYPDLNACLYALSSPAPQKRVRP